MKRWGLTSAAMAMAAIGVPGAAIAQDAGLSAGDKIFRVRAILVAPQDSSGDILPGLPGEEVTVNDDLMPEVDFTYMVTDNVGLELIAATSKHSFSGVSGVTGGIGKLGSTWVLPPTLTLQYHFNPKGKVRPYVGAGVNYTIFYSEDASSGLEAAVGDTDVSLDDSFGPSVQAGVDIAVRDNMVVNFDVKWIDMDTEARLDTFALGVQEVDVSIDPLVFGAGVGWVF